MSLDELKAELNREMIEAQARQRAVDLVETAAEAVRVLALPVELQAIGGELVLRVTVFEPMVVTCKLASDAGGHDVVSPAPVQEEDAPRPEEPADGEPAQTGGKSAAEGPSKEEADFAPAALPKDAPVALKLVQSHLNAVGYAAPWTPELDCKLIAGLTGGRKLPAVAGDLGLPLEDCRQRFAFLCPEPGFEAQSRLLKVLQHRAGQTQPEKE
ncbi:hypothetical protein [Oceanicola sp. S124]|uniref:hypothetical protein n=1 Tax=Oceanicola sp. S124 TaxID=1042378 RepID=UPI0002559EFE|nr:hypothetical protein [Oceanicola sp. S124]